jgi:NhaP-type Na+/H+ or K+/H+ antiporter
VEPNPDAHAALTVALALTGGMVAQALARHMRLPGIVLLLATGVVLGPDVADVIQPEALGSALYVLVGFAVAVILFEGGMNLNLKRLRAEAGVIQRLLTVGALITMGGAALAARLIMGWDWSLAIAFGSLVIVTGPTVVTPLLRRIKVKHTVSTVLEAEGVLIDAIGAVVAVVTLEVLVVSSVTTGLLDIIERLGLGMLLGLTGGFLLAILLRYKRVVPCPRGWRTCLPCRSSSACSKSATSFSPRAGSSPSPWPGWSSATPESTCSGTCWSSRSS